MAMLPLILQEETLDLERARLEALRRREQDRAKRFMNAKNRSIGIDKSYLDRQIEEKRQLELAQREEKLAEAENLKHLVQCLDNNEAEVQEARQRSLNEIKRSLDEQTKQPKNNALKDGPLDLANCGPSSLQCFSGEDHAQGTRKKAQQDQVKLWCAEYMVEKKRALDAERREEQDYANYVLEQDIIRSQLEEESKRKKDEEARLRQMENLEYARQARQRKEHEMEADNEAQRLQSHYLQTCPLLTEDTRLATNVNAKHRFRPDHFKGFQKDHVKQLYRENDAVVCEKREISNREANLEANWAKYHDQVVDKMRDAEEARQRMVAEENRVQMEILGQQKKENKEAELERNRHPEIGSEFFTRFGQSCR
mmetsp:Transcript_181/g.436  ORF Transcript_181/g.436 Transcript_181/m.436 type:complete len:368 (+) Transcript_181:143-1246(+)